MCPSQPTGDHHGPRCGRRADRVRVALAVLWLVSGLAHGAPVRAADDARERTAGPELEVDAAHAAGTIRPLHGVNSGPLTGGGTLDLSPAFREIAPPLVRLHDCHWPNPDVVDVHAVFPDPHADPARPESYDFARTDEYVRAVIALGSGVVFRLGESVEHQKVKRHVRPPQDPAKWAAVCVGIIRHYNDGWAGGFHYRIRYWEIWNEPDNRPAMWTGTDRDYLRLYGTAAKVIKRQFPRLRVGGPGLGNTGRLQGDRLEPAPFLRRFLEHCRRDAAPLDFFSWHAYASDPCAVARRARAVRRLLDTSGFPRAESHLNEWNYLPGDDWTPMLSSDARARQRWYERVGGAEGAAFAAATLLLLQDTPVDAANYFSADAQGMGLFDCNGVPKKSFFALKAFKALADAPDRLAVRGAVPSGVAACAGVSKDRTAVTVLLSKFRGPAVTLAIRSSGLPWQRRTHYDLFMLNGEHELTRVRGGSIGPGGRLVQELRSPSVCMLKLRSGGAGP
jgi:hypothetical protein